jgi:predicted transcriptional regulator of viral defense system
VRFAKKYLNQDVEHHMVSGVDVPVFSVAKTLADLFRNGRLCGLSMLS